MHNTFHILKFLIASCPSLSQLSAESIFYQIGPLVLVSLSFSSPFCLIPSFFLSLILLYPSSSELHGKFAPKFSFISPHCLLYAAKQPCSTGQSHPLNSWIYKRLIICYSRLGHFYSIRWRDEFWSTWTLIQIYSGKQSICINKGFNYLNTKSGKFEFHFSEYLVIIYTRVKELHISWSLHVPCSASVGLGNSTKAWSERLWRGSQDQWKNHARLFFIDFSTACNCILPHLLWSSYPTLTWTLILSVGWGIF